ncbi:hypothetical protein ACFO5R_01730 [Halosolutus amylolyticus]|uniref:Uncharacterized protein n=1 Tax=Halosolutus amylolyticus TaxID=2932267 RepID=A0ABD5PJB4_9EURY|nr:hypothetical protein [Halosolutus amylolyticus]
MTDGNRRSTTVGTDSRNGFVRETYEEYDVGSMRVGMIADPENEHAWIQSDVTVPVHP